MKPGDRDYEPEAPVGTAKLGPSQAGLLFERAMAEEEREAALDAQWEADDEANEAEEEEDDDDDEDEGGDDEEEYDEEEDDEDEYGDEVYDWNPNVIKNKYDDRYFKHGENIRKTFNEFELDSFMNILNMKPTPQWQDNEIHHYKVGAHDYEDEAQMTDPYFHLLAEVERKALDRNEAYMFRQGSEVKLIPDAKKAPVFSRK